MHFHSLKQNSRPKRIELRALKNKRPTQRTRHLADGPPGANHHNPRNSPKLPIDGSPKPLRVSRWNFGDTMGTPKGRYAPKILASNSPQIPESRMSWLNLKNSQSTKYHQLRELYTRFEGQDHQEKSHTNLMCDSQHNTRKAMPPKPSTKIPRKNFENH
jgi:hypothetical protein